jgi:hypothetical protein
MKNRSWSFDPKTFTAATVTLDAFDHRPEAQLPVSARLTAQADDLPILVVVLRAALAGAHAPAATWHDLELMRTPIEAAAEQLVRRGAFCTYRDLVSERPWLIVDKL